MFAGGIVTAILADDPLLRGIGVFNMLASLISWLLTQQEIDELKEKAKKAVYIGETIGCVPDVDTTALKEQLKKDHPDLNP